MAHPIRPESYIAMDNFYTPTVYEKGAEVIRMYRTLLGGKEPFRRGMDLYFARHDGSAVRARSRSLVVVGVVVALARSAAETTSRARVFGFGRRGLAACRDDGRLPAAAARYTYACGLCRSER